jgi:hypothetical protein
MMIFVPQSRTKPRVSFYIVVKKFWRKIPMIRAFKKKAVIPPIFVREARRGKNKKNGKK